MKTYECYGDRLDIRGQVLRMGDRIELDEAEAADHIAADVPIRLAEEIPATPAEEMNNGTV